MQSKALFRSWFVIGAIALSASTLPLEQKLRDSDHKKIGKKIAAYYEAKLEKKGIQAAFLKVSQSIDKAQKKLKQLPILACVEDWERALWYAQQTTYKGRPKTGRVMFAKLDSYGDKILTAYHLPSKYTSKKGPYPLVLVIPDAGEKADNHLEGQWTDAALLNEAILVTANMPSDTSSWEKFFIDKDKESGVWSVMKAFGVAKLHFAIDMNKVFLAGSGKGFAAAVATAASFPQLFAGVIGRGEIPQMDATNFRNLPTLLLSPAQAAKDFEAEVGRLGYDNCTVKAEGGPGDVAAFVDEKVRNSYPEEITFSPYCDNSRATQWVVVDGFEVDTSKGLEDQPRLDAKVDRSSNTVTIEAKDISKIIVYLNDSLVDMGRPVKFLINGTSHEELLPRNKRMMLDYAFSSGDWGRVFTASLEREVPARPTSGE